MVISNNENAMLLLTLKTKQLDMKYKPDLLVPPRGPDGNLSSANFDASFQFQIVTVLSRLETASKKDDAD